MGNALFNILCLLIYLWFLQGQILVTDLTPLKAGPRERFRVSREVTVRPRHPRSLFHTSERSVSAAATGTARPLSADRLILWKTIHWTVTFYFFFPWKTFFITSDFKKIVKVKWLYFLILTALLCFMLLKDYNSIRILTDIEQRIHKGIII